MSRTIKVTLKKSLNSTRATQRRTAVCLGLRRINRSRTFKDSPALRGQIKKIQHLLSWEEQ